MKTVLLENLIACGATFAQAVALRASWANTLTALGWRRFPKTPVSPCTSRSRLI